jgi:DNA-binding XRE family transcriptional regulator
MPRLLTKEQRTFILKQWWMSGNKLHAVNAAFRHEFPNDEIPARQTIYRLAKKFDETGSVEDASRSGRPTSVTTEENMQLVSQNFHLSPQTSQRSAARDLGISRSSLQRIMKDLKLKPYKPKLLQALNEDDPDRRMEFCEWILDSIEKNPNLLDQILWTDEATFQLNGRVNRHKCVYWSDNNPHFIIEQELHTPRVIVWGGIWSNGVVGPFYFEDTVTSDNYLQMLKNNIISQLEEHPNFETMIWQQDGAPPHYGQAVRDYLDNTFAQWIGRRGTIEWPPRSPDLTPCDFSLWGIIDHVYAARPRDLDHLKLLIEEEFTSLNDNIELCQSICRSVANRCQICINIEGKQFEHLL